MIDTHTHIIPPASVTGTQGSQWPCLVVDDGGGKVMRNGELFRPVTPGGYDLSQRIADMDVAGVSIAMVSPMPEYFCYWAPTEAAVAHCGAVNAWLATQVAASQGRVEALGILPMQDPGAAIALLDDVVRLGLRGVQVGSRIGDLLIGDPAFHAVFAACAERDLIVFVHTFQPCYEDAFGTDMVGTAAMFPVEIGYAVHSMVASGLLGHEQLPEILVSHGGGGAHHTLARLQWAWDHDVADTRARLGIAPSDALRRLHVDSLVFGEDEVRNLVVSMGADRVCIGSDYPFIPGPIGWNVTERSLEEPDLHAVRLGTAARLIGRGA